MADPETRQAPRLGPRPLPLHLGLATLAWQSSKAALPLLSNGWQPSKRGAAELLQGLDKADPEALRRAVEKEADRRLGRFLSGIEAYRAHPYRRTLADPPALWQEGTTRLRGYGVGAGRGRPLLVVPSLINRATILDLKTESSLLRWLARRGFRPFLVDWDRPGPAERDFSLTDYIAGRLERALDAVLTESGRRPILVGYCMGGLLALALALRREADLSGLALLATPWDFHAEAPAQARLVAASLVTFEPLIDLTGELPVDVIQSLFASLDPLQALRKFLAFAALDRDDPRAALFVAVEDWLNDGVPLVGAVARECLSGWYGANATASGGWRVAGRVVDPAALRLPTLCLVPANDRIVPPASAKALARRLPGAVVRRPRTGHVGMVVGGGARRRVWAPLAKWLAEAGG